MRSMNVFFQALLCGLSIALLALPAHAAILKVGTCGDCTYATISAAVADSVGGDRIEVYGGVYNETVNLNTMNTKGSIALVAVGATTIHSVPGEPGIVYDKADAGGANFPGNIGIVGFEITSDNSAIVLLGVTGNVTITDCILDGITGIGCWTSEITGNVTILDCTSDNAVGIGIWTDIITGNVTINNCTTNNVTGIGIWVESVTGNVSMNGCTTDNATGIGTWLADITGDVTLEHYNANNNDNGIWLDHLSSGGTNVVGCSNMTGNRACGLFLSRGNFNVEAVNNWWGDASGPTHTGNPGGSGDVICEESGANEYTGTVVFDPWLSGPFEVSPPCRIVPIPTFNQWGLIVLAVSMAGAAVWAGRRRTKVCS